MKNKFLAIFLSVLVVSGCSLFSKSNPFKEEVYNPNPGRVRMNAGVNPYLWQATLGKLSFMPLNIVDSKGGVIVSDWYTMSGVENERFKVTAHILSKELRTDALEVVVFKRIFEEDRWIDVEPDSRVHFELEKSILNEARRLYRRDVITRKK